MASHMKDSRVKSIHFLDRASGEVKKEKIYGQFFIELYYGASWISKFFYRFILPLTVSVPFLSHLYGKMQKGKRSRKKVLPFIELYKVDATEFAKPAEAFTSFNDFFIRTLKLSARPLDQDKKVAVLPADGRHLFFQNLKKSDGFFVKGKQFDLQKLLQDETLAARYENGSLVISRLCPIDYHRFHFPFDCTPSNATLINGPLYSVNPIALRRNIAILNENKRMITTLETKWFGTVVFIEVGATFVGAIKQTYTSQKEVKKGDEKGYFEFGGSCLLMLFEPHAIRFDEDLIRASKKQMEVKANMGERFGEAL